MRNYFIQEYMSYLKIFGKNIVKQWSLGKKKEKCFIKSQGHCAKVFSLMHLSFMILINHFMRLLNQKKETQQPSKSCKTLPCQNLIFGASKQKIKNKILHLIFLWILISILFLFWVKQVLVKLS